MPIFSPCLSGKIINLLHNNIINGEDRYVLKFAQTDLQFVHMVCLYCFGFVASSGSVTST